MKKFISLAMIALLSLTVIATKPAIATEELEEPQEIIQEFFEEEKEGTETEEGTEGEVEESEQEAELKEELPEEKAEEGEIAPEEAEEEGEEQEEAATQEEELAEEGTEGQQELEGTIEEEPEENPEGFEDVEIDRPVEGESLDEAPVTMALLGEELEEYEPTEKELEEYFTVDNEFLEYNGNIQAPNVVLEDGAPDFRYRVDFEVVTADGERLPSFPVNVGGYILRAVISYSPADTLIGAILFHKTKVLEFPYYIVPMEISKNDIELSELTYNGEGQFPTMSVYGHELKEGVDFTFNSDYSNNINAYDLTGQIDHSANINLINYNIWDGSSSNHVIHYTINKRDLYLPDKIHDTYTGNVITPSIYALDESGNEVALDYYNQPIIFKEGTFADYVIAEYKNPGNYSALIELKRSFLLNNTVDAEDKTPLTPTTYTAVIPAIIDKAVIEYDFDALYYNGENQIPEFKFTGVDGIEGGLNNHIRVLTDTITDYAGTPLYKWAEVGSYYIDVKMDDEIAKYYVWDEIIAAEDSQYATIGYRINKREVEFSNWDLEEGESIEIEGSLLSLTTTFKYTMEDGILCLEYNGYNPFLFKAINGSAPYGYAPIPGAKYTYVGSDKKAEDIQREDYEFLPSLPSEALKLGVGTYYSTIVLENDSYATQRATATFKVTPKPVTVNWTKTIIDINDEDKDPKCEIVGLVPIDQIGFYFKDDNKEWQNKDRFYAGYSYYKFDADGNPVKVADFPVKYSFTEPGRYAVKVENIVNLLGDVNHNYVVENEWTSFVVVDNTTVNPSVDGNITVGTISMIENSVDSVELQAPTVNQMEALIARLDALGDDTGEVLQDAIDEGKNINIYLVASDVTEDEINEKGLIIPSNNAAVINLELYATVDGDINRYQLTDTGNYKVGVTVKLTEAEAEALGYNSARCFYIARYHGDSKTPTATQMTDPTYSNGIYSFTLSSNQFSDFAIYTGNKPVHIETDDEHIVPITQA